MQTVTLKVHEDSIDDIVVNEITGAIRREMIPYKDEGGQYLDIDVSLVKSLVQVLQYFTTKDQFESYKTKLKFEEYL
jgi:hypothetical protein